MNKRPSIPADLVPEALRFALADPPVVGMILGSGLGHIANAIETPIKVPASAIPNYPASTVAGHEGVFVVGRLAGHRAIVLKGRVHSYEGHSMAAVATPVRIFAALGVRFVVLTNAAGGINRDFQPGDLMAITDHLNLTRQSPLTGRNADEYGPRFPDQSQVYPPSLRQALRDHAEKQGVKMHTGVYACLPGPEYETPAEIRMLRILGADAVGMSTVPEATTAAHAGIPVLGVSMISNLAAGISKAALSHTEVLECAEKAGATLGQLLAGALPALCHSLPKSR